MPKQPLVESVKARARELHKTYPLIRDGQVASNALSELCPTMAVELRNTEWDPYLDDSRLGNFYLAVEKLEPEHVNTTGNRMILSHPGVRNEQTSQATRF